MKLNRLIREQLEVNFRNPFFRKVGQRFAELVGIKLIRYIPLMSAKGKGVNPYAFIRVCNEIETLQASLNSIEGVLTRGIIGYHNCTDGSEEIILDFCKRNSGFHAVHYTNEIYPVNDKRYETSPEEAKEYSLAKYYNTIFSHIPDGEWFIKIDADHVYDKKKLQQLLHLPETNNDCIMLSRLNLVFCNGRLYYQKENPLIQPNDHWLLRKTPDLVFEMDYGYDDDGRFYAWELLRIPSGIYIYTDVTNWHFAWQKKSRQRFLIKKNLGEIETLDETLRSQKLPYTADMVDPAYISKHISELLPVTVPLATFEE